jgi:hypothetical protein
MIMATDNGAGRVLRSYIERRGVVVITAVATWQDASRHDMQPAGKAGKKGSNTIMVIYLSI